MNLPKIEINSSTKPCTSHAVFYYFLSDYSKQDVATNTARSKRFIEMLKEQKVLTSGLITIWENTDGCAEQYRYASALYLMSFPPQY